MADVMKSKVVAIGDSSTELLAAVSSGTTVISMLQIGNVDGSAGCTVTLSANKNGGGDTNFLVAANVPAGKALPVFSSEVGKMILVDDGTPDTLDAVAATAGDLVAIISYVERT